MTDSKKTAYVFPGQGSQFAGMGHDLYQNNDTAKEIFEQADKALGFPLSKLCFEGPEDDLRQTINAQPALVTVSYACLKVAQENAAENALPNPAFVAGHSLGEYTALAAVGAVDFTTAVTLARERGRLMHEAGQAQPGSMAAILGLEESVLDGICQQTDTIIANINSPGQLVISGATENVARAEEMAKEAGAKRTVQLPVSGAFHSKLMQPAVDGMAEKLSAVVFNDPAVPIIANTTAKPITSGKQIKDELLNQLRNSVQWQRSIEYMIDNGVSSFIEIGPGKVLTGLIKRINRDVETINL